MEDISKTTYTCMILDDDLMSIEILKSHLFEMDYMNLVGSFNEPIEAAAAFQNFEYIDFLFLDIGMEISGLDMARMLKGKVKFIVFVTAYKEFALDAFEHGDAYLVKPVSFQTLLKSINQLIERNAKQMNISSGKN